MDEIIRFGEACRSLYGCVRHSANLTFLNPHYVSIVTTSFIIVLGIMIVYHFLNKLFIKN